VHSARDAAEKEPWSWRKNLFWKQFLSSDADEKEEKLQKEIIPIKSGGLAG